MTSTALWLTLVIVALPAAGETVLERAADLVAPRCITPVAGDAIKALFDQGGLAPVLGQEFTLEKVNIGKDQIELQIKDHGAHLYSLILAIPGVKAGRAAGGGPHFQYYRVADAPADSPADQALLAAAALIDRALPDAALERCGVTEAPPPEQARHPQDPRYPRRLALASAALQVVVLLLAIAFGLHATRARIGSDDDGRRLR